MVPPPFTNARSRAATSHRRKYQMLSDGGPHDRQSHSGHCPCSVGQPWPDLVAARLFISWGKERSVVMNMDGRRSRNRLAAHGCLRDAAGSAVISIRQRNLRAWPRFAAPITNLLFGSLHAPRRKPGRVRKFNDQVCRFVRARGTPGAGVGGEKSEIRITLSRGAAATVRALSAANSLRAAAS
jgi:hypothetical protein